MGPRMVQLAHRGCHSLCAARKLASVVDTRKCGGVRRSLSGRISSAFSWRPKCTWTIQLKSGYQITLTIPFLRSVLRGGFFADVVV